jgi:hypothetical protein
MSKFKVGDRVRCYSVFPPFVGEVMSVGDNDHPGAIYLRALGGPWSGKTRLEWPKACRKLVKKERRRVVMEYIAGDGWSILESPCAAPRGEDPVTFVEVRRKK